jgi:single-strand DNA-binding protein
MQSITILGRLGADPERRTSGSGKPYLTFNIAPQQARDEEPTWYSCSAFGQTADLIENYCQKGSLLCVAGELKVRKKDDRTFLNVTVNIVTFGPKPTAGAPAGSPSPSAGSDEYDPFLDA